MPLPLKPGCNIYVSKWKREAHYEMKSLEENPGYYSMSYIISGTRKFITPDSITILSKGCIGTAPPYVYHRTSYASDETYERILVKFTAAVIERLVAVIGIKPFTTFFNIPVHYFPDETRIKIYHIFCEMLEVYEQNDNTSELLLEGMLNNILVTAINNELSSSVGETTHQTKYDKVVRDALKFVENHYLDDPSLSAVANYVGMSPTYFSKVFKEQTTITYSTYVRNVKIKHVNELLISTKLSISEIAALCGFSNANYLCDVFKKEQNMSPKDFRKKYT